MPALLGPFTNTPAFESPPDDALVTSIEAELGHQLPAAYVALARQEIDYRITKLVPDFATSSPA